MPRQVTGRSERIAYRSALWRGTWIAFSSIRPGGSPVSYPPPTTASDDPSNGPRAGASERKFLPEAVETTAQTDSIGAVADASFRRLSASRQTPGSATSSGACCRSGATARPERDRRSRRRMKLGRLVRLIFGAGGKPKKRLLGGLSALVQVGDYLPDRAADRARNDNATARRETQCTFGARGAQRTRQGTVGPRRPAPPLFLTPDCASWQSRGRDEGTSFAGLSPRHWIARRLRWQ